jgi:hypothetical protein
MAYYIHFVGWLKEPVDVPGFVTAVTKIAQRNGWDVQDSDSKAPGVIVKIPAADPIHFTVHFKEHAAVLDYFKYTGKNRAKLTKIFEMFYAITPLFQVLNVDDDLGYWYEFAVAKDTKTPLPGLRELTSDEKNELERGFDLPDIADDIFSLSPGKSVLMNIIRKDMSPDLSHPATLDDLLTNLLPLAVRGSPFNKNNPYLISNQFTTIVCNWVLSRCTTGTGEKILQYKDRDNGFLVFTDIMCETVFIDAYRSHGMTLQRLQNFYDSLVEKGVDMDDRETFLCFLYSCLNYADIIRPHELIVRRK